MNGCTHEEVEWYEEEIENWQGDNYIETKTRTVSLLEDVICIGIDAADAERLDIILVPQKIFLKTEKHVQLKDLTNV